MSIVATVSNLEKDFLLFNLIKENFYDSDGKLVYQTDTSALMDQKKYPIKFIFGDPEFSYLYISVNNFSDTNKNIEIWVNEQNYQNNMLILIIILACLEFVLCILICVKYIYDRHISQNKNLDEIVNEDQLTEKEDK